jgi:hypothetical protein
MVAVFRSGAWGFLERASVDTSNKVVRRQIIDFSMDKIKVECVKDEVCHVQPLNQNKDGVSLLVGTILFPGQFPINYADTTPCFQCGFKSKALSK